MKTQQLLIISACFFASLLTGCSNYEQNQTVAAFSHSPNSSSPCRAIKQQLNALSSSQLPANSIYPPQTGATPTAIQKARLLREYEYYNCQD